MIAKILSRALPLCKYDLHLPHRSGPERVRWDGIGLIGQCKRCGAEITRVKSGVWHMQP